MITEQHSSARSCTAFQTSMDDFQPSTRITGNNARGNKRRIGHSKRSSVDPVDDGPKKKRKDVEDRGPTVDSEAMPSLPGANSFFHNQRVGSKGIKGKIQDAVENGELLQITQAQFDAFLELAATQDPDRPFIEQMRKQHVKILPNLTWLLLTDRNLLLYGIGSKQRLLHELVHSFLTGEDVIEINAPLGNNALAPPPVGEQQVIKALLSHIERTVLKNKNVEACGLSLENRAQVVADLLDIHYCRGFKSAALATALPLSPLAAKNTSLNTSTSAASAFDNAAATRAAGTKTRASRVPVDNAERWGGRFAHAQSRLYLIIHDICGTALSDPVTQHCLATLASCASVSIVATLGNLNSMVHWDSRVLAQFAWSYHHIATFDRYNIPAGAEFPLVVPNNAVLAIQEFNPAAEENEDEDDLEAEGVDTSAPLTGGSRRLAPPQAQPSAGKAAVITTAAMAATARAFHSMEAIRSSLTNKHAQLLAAMVELLRKRSRQMEEEAAAALEATSSGMMRSKRIAAQPTRALNAHQLSHHYGVPIDELYGKLRSTLNVKSRNDVLSLLKEYYDHGVIAKIVHQNVEYLCLKPPYSLKNVDAKGALIL